MSQKSHQQTVNTIQDWPFRYCSDGGGPYLSHISYNDETWHNYSFPREDHMTQPLSSADISTFLQETCNFCYTDCILIHNF